MRRGCRGVRAGDRLELAQVAVEDVNDLGVEGDVALAIVQRQDLLLNAPQRRAHVGQIGQQQVELVVRNIDVFGRNAFGRHLATADGVLDHLPRVEDCL